MLRNQKGGGPLNLGPVSSRNLNEYIATAGCLVVLLTLLHNQLCPLCQSNLSSRKQYSSGQQLAARGPKLARLQ